MPGRASGLGRPAAFTTVVSLIKFCAIGKSTGVANAYAQTVQIRSAPCAGIAQVERVSHRAAIVHASARARQPHGFGRRQYVTNLSERDPRHVWGISFLAVLPSRGKLIPTRN